MLDGGGNGMTAPTAPRPTRMTADEFLARAHEFERAELVDGRVVEMAPTGWKHGAIEVAFVHVLKEHVDRIGEGVVVAGEVGYRLADDQVRAPDVAVHLVPLPAEEPFPTTMPDLAAEVVSPSDRWAAVERKVDQWLEAGVAEVWLADPDHAKLTVRRPEGRIRVLRSGDTVETEVLPGLSPALDDVFG